MNIVADNPGVGVLFDLDGTLVDTAPDLAFALNETLRHFGREPMPYGPIRDVVSHGGTALIRLGFGIEPEQDNFETYRQFLLNIYKDNLCRETRLFDGMDGLLDYLETRDIPWGIITNKPSWLTDPLMKDMGLDRRAACIVSGDTCARSKPHPDPILHGCELADLDATRCLYIGDAERDIQAGRAAGCTTVTALFGYIHDDDQPEQWSADFTIEHPMEIAGLLNKIPAISAPA